MRTLLTAKRLWTGTSLLDQPVILIEHGRIASIDSRVASELRSRAVTWSSTIPNHAQPRILRRPHPRRRRHDVMEATPEALTTIGRFLAAMEAGRYLATTVTAPLDATLQSLSGLANLIAHIRPMQPRP